MLPAGGLVVEVGAEVAVVVVVVEEMAVVDEEAFLVVAIVIPLLQVSMTTPPQKGLL
jgi:hypothetical protein